jgi:hypothetical protein
MIQELDAALRVSVGLAAISSPDQGDTVATIFEWLKDREADKDKTPRPLVQWDIVRGLIGLNREGDAEVQRQMPEPDPELGGASPQALTQNPTDALRVIQEFGPRTITFMFNAQLYLGVDSVQQAIWNLRDTNKSKFRMLIMLSPTFILPPTLAQDVLMMDEPLPRTEELIRIIQKNRDDFNLFQKKKGGEVKLLPELEPAVVNRAASAAVGLNAFSADQAVAMNISEKGINIGGLWKRKTNMVGQIKGLTISRGNERFKDYVGNENAKAMFSGFVNGRKRPKGIVLFDEIEKDFAGNRGDNTGVSQEFHGKLLSVIEDMNIDCILSHGVWGSGKTYLAKAARNEAEGGEIVLIKASLSEMKSGIVGSSMSNLMMAIKTIMALCDDIPLFDFTCNSMEPLSPEFKSRLKVKLFFDLPGEEEIEALWRVYMRTYELKKQPIPASIGWTGRDVRNCCDLAWSLNLTLENAARSIVPQAVASKDKLIQIRKEAHGKLISASTSGLYYYKEAGETVPGSSRAFEN